MEYCQLAEVHGETMDDHRAFLEVLGLENEPPDGLLGRAVGPTAGGVRIVTLWESKAAHDRFIAERLGPALGEGRPGGRSGGGRGRLPGGGAVPGGGPGADGLTLQAGSEALNHDTEKEASRCAHCLPSSPRSAISTR